MEKNGEISDAKASERASEGEKVRGVKGALGSDNNCDHDENVFNALAFVFAVYTQAQLILCKLLNAFLRSRVDNLGQQRTHSHLKLFLCVRWGKRRKPFNFH